MQRKLIITINIPILLTMLFLIAVIYCRYNLETKQGYMFLIEVLFGLLIVSRKSPQKAGEISNRLETEGYKQLLYVHISFMLYRMVISIITSGDWQNSIKTILYYEFGVIFLMYNVVSCLSMNRVINLLLSFGVINAIIGMYESLTRSSVFLDLISIKSRRYVSSILRTDDSRATSIFMHPIIFAVFISAIWCVLLYYPIRNKYLNLTIKLLILFCLIGTKSRSSWISFIIVNVIYLIQRVFDKGLVIEWRNILYYLTIIILSIILLIFFRTYITQIWEVIENRWMNGLDSSDVSHNQRVEMIRLGIREYMNWGILSKLFGKGSGYAINLLQHHAKRGWTKAVDNTYLTVLLDYGIFGFFFLIYYLFFCIKSFLNKSRVFRLSGLGLFSIFISAFFYDMFGWFTPDFLIALFVSIIVKNENEKRLMYS